MGLPLGIILAEDAVLGRSWAQEVVYKEGGSSGGQSAEGARKRERLRKENANFLGCFSVCLFHVIVVITENNFAPVPKIYGARGQMTLVRHWPRIGRKPSGF